MAKSHEWYGRVVPATSRSESIVAFASYATTGDDRPCTGARGPSNKEHLLISLWCQVQQFSQSWTLQHESSRRSSPWEGVERNHKEVWRPANKISIRQSLSTGQMHANSWRAKCHKHRLDITSRVHHESWRRCNSVNRAFCTTVFQLLDVRSLQVVRHEGTTMRMNCPRVFNSFKKATLWSQQAQCTGIEDSDCLLRLRSMIVDAIYTIASTKGWCYDQPTMTLATLARPWGWFLKHHPRPWPPRWHSSNLHVFSSTEAKGMSRVGHGHLFPLCGFWPLKTSLVSEKAPISLPISFISWYLFPSCLVVHGGIHPVQPRNGIQTGPVGWGSEGFRPRWAMAPKLI